MGSISYSGSNATLVRPATQGGVNSFRSHAKTWESYRRDWSPRRSPLCPKGCLGRFIKPWQSPSHLVGSCDRLSFLNRGLAKRGTINKLRSGGCLSGPYHE